MASKWRELTHRLASQIRRGDYTPGQRLPRIRYPGASVSMWSFLGPEVRLWPKRRRPTRAFVCSYRKHHFLV